MHLAALTAIVRAGVRTGSDVLILLDLVDAYVEINPFILEVLRYLWD